MRQPLHTRLRLPHWIAIDAAAAVVFLIFYGSLPASQSDRLPIAVGYVLVVAATLPIAVRRVWPLLAFVVVLAADVTAVVVQLFAAPTPTVAVVIYTVAFLAPRRVAVGALAVALLADVLLAVPLPWLPWLPGAGGTAVPAATLTLAGWCLGIAARSQREYVRARLADEADRVAAEERLRIARELHDVVANGMSLIALQAGVAGYVVDTRPDVVRSALASIEETSRASLTELRQMLPTLRGGSSTGGGTAMDVAPGLADLPALVERSRAAGLAVTLRVGGTPHPVPTGMGLSAYRIVQEALTNITKHARATTATVDVEHGPTALVVTVTDDGAGPVTSTPAGHGLLGMRERVAVYGGTLTAGPADPPAPGFRVRAEIPWEHQ